MNVSTLIKYSFLFIGVYLIVSICAGVEGFDLHRSYEEAETYVQVFSVGEVVLYRLLKTVDFIYYLIHYYALKLSVTPNLVTTLIVFTYYCLTIYATQRVFKVKVSNLVLLITLFTVPSIYVISVARNLTAFMFLFCSIVLYYRGKSVLSVIFILIGVFTHFTTLMYVAVMISALFMRNCKISDGSLAVILVASFFISIIAPTLINDIMFKIIGGQDMHYMAYSTDVARNYLFHSSINYADKLPVTLCYIYSVLLLFANKNRGKEFWSLLLLTIMLSFFMNSSFSLVTRCVMFLPIFWGLNVGKIMSSSSVKSKIYVKYISWLGTACLVLHLYGYRQIYFAFL